MGRDTMHLILAIVPCVSPIVIVLVELILNLEWSTRPMIEWYHLVEVIYGEGFYLIQRLVIAVVIPGDRMGTIESMLPN